MTPSTLTETLSLQLRYTHGVANRNLDGITEDQALAAPFAGGNSINRVLGHLVDARNGMLGLLGRGPVLDAAVAKAYARGTTPDSQPAALADLQAAFHAAQDQLLAALAEADAVLDKPAPYSPLDNPKETVGSLLAMLLFHEAYHVGQLGVLRRATGAAGAIA